MRVVIGEDSVLLREGIVRLLTERGIDVVGQAGDGEDLLRKARAHKPDVAIADVRMPPTNTTEGLIAARAIREELPGTAVLVLSQYVEREYAIELLADERGGVGYLLKDRVADIDGFIDSIERVAAGGSALDPVVVSELLGGGGGSSPVDRLSGREREVLELMAQGMTNNAIAEALFVTPSTVEKHVTGIFDKFELDSPAEGHRRVLAVLEYLDY